MKPALENNKDITDFEGYLFRKWRENRGPFLASDIIIEYWDKKSDKEGIVLIERKNYPYGLALPGGIAERLTLPQNAVKEAKEETGLDIRIYDENQPFCVFSDIKQDLRAFIVSVTYQAVGSGILKPAENEDAKSARVYEYDGVLSLLKDPKLWAFSHHRKIVELYVNRIWRHNINYKM